MRGIAQRSLVALVILVDCGAERQDKIKICRRNSCWRRTLSRYWSRFSVTSLTKFHQTHILTCANLAVNGRGRLSRRGQAAPLLNRDSGGWLGAAVMMQGGSHLGGHASQRGATLRRTHAAVMVVTSWSRRARATSGRRRQTRMWNLRGLCWGSVISWLSIVGSWSAIRMLLDVLGIRRRRS